MSDEVVQLGGGWTLTVTNKPGGVSTFELWDPRHALDEWGNTYEGGGSALVAHTNYDPWGESSEESADPDALRARAGLYMRLALDLDAREAVIGDAEPDR